MRVLIVEDQVKMASLIRRGMRGEGIAADVAIKGEDALWMAEATDYDAIVLDIMLPGIDGLEVCRRLRASGVWSPILLLTARDAVSDRVAGLDAGADDYLPKPFDLDELLARLRALHRRTAYDDLDVIEVDDLVIDVGSRNVQRAGTEIELSPREFDILHLLAANVGKVISRYTILDEVWDGETDLRSNVIDVYLANIRAKIDKPFGTSTITTVRGAGYRLEQGGKSGAS